MVKQGSDSGWKSWELTEKLGENPVRKLTIAIVFGALLLPNQALTLGLGDIEVSSALNQQLDAEIELLSASEGDAEALIVQLASREEFQRAGLDRPFMLSSIRFTTETRDGVPYIKVVTPKPIREPFLNFLVEVDWPQGHLIREYTILLDPPIFSGRPAPEQSSSSSRPAMSDTPAAVTQQPMMQDVGDFRPEPTSSMETPSTGTTLSGMARAGFGGTPKDRLLPLSADGYRIQKGDTAWSLAESLRPDPSVSVAKMMLALLRTNPEAFIQGNVNGLKRGYILRVPEMSEINAINQAEALAMVREQNALWREYQQAMSSGKPMPGHDTGMKSDGAMSTGVGSGRLAIVGVDGGSSTGIDPTAMSAEELRSELALTAERLETERLEKEGLQNRLEAVQSQLDNMKGLVSIEDREMAEMQAQVSPPTAETAEPEVMEEPATEATDAEEPVVEKIEVPEEVTPKALEQPAKPKVVAPPAPPASPVMPEAEPGLLEDPMILMAGGAVLLILLALVALAIKRRRASSEDEGEEEAVTETEESLTEAEGGIDDDATQVADEEGESDEEDHESTVILQAVPSHEETVITEAKTVITEAVAPVATAAAPVEEETDDVMAEADVYLAYGIYQQAEELLQGAIKNNPDREMYRVKLCETFYAAKNAEGFETAAKELHEQSGGEETAGWLKVAALGKDLCPDSELFKGVDVSAVADAVVVEPVAPAEMDIDLGGDENAAEETDLDFDIDAPEPVDEPLEIPDFDEPSTEEAGTVAEEPAEEAELEFDLSETDALDMSEESENKEEEFSLDIEASELDISDAESEEDSEAEPSSKETEGEFVDNSLDFGIDEIEGTEISDDADIDLDMSAGEESASDDTEADGFDISMDMDDEGFTDDSLDVAMGLEESETSTDDDVLDISMDLDEGDGLEGLIEETADDSSEDDGVIDIGLDMDEEDVSDDDTSIDNHEKTMILSSDDLDLPELGDVDEISTKLDLARAYMDMGDHDGSRSILDEVIAEGNDEQKKEAEDLLKEISS